MLKWLNQVVSGGEDGSLGSVVDTEFIEDMNDMAFNGVGTDGEMLGNFVVGIPFGH